MPSTWQNKLPVEILPLGHQGQPWIKKKILRVTRVIGQIQLSGEYLTALALNFDMQVWCSSRIGARNDRFQEKFSFAIGELMPPQTKAFCVVLASFIALPKV